MVNGVETPQENAYLSCSGPGLVSMHPGSVCGLSRRFGSLDADRSDQPLCSLDGHRQPGRLGRTAVVERITAHREEGRPDHAHLLLARLLILVAEANPRPHVPRLRHP